MPIDSSKFSSNSLTGTVRVVNGFANISLPTAFYALEGNVTFNVQVRTDSTQGAVIYTSPTVTLRDTSSFVSLTANTATVNEGDLVAFTLVTANALGNSTLYYSVFPATANVTSSDFVANTGSFSLTNNAGIFTLKANADLSLINETGENFRVQLRTVSPVGNVVYTTSNIAIADTSNAYNILTFAPAASISLESSNITFTFRATNIPFGTVFYYGTTGNALVSANTGSFVLNSISNTFTISAGDVPTSATRAFTVNLRTGSAAGPIVATSSTAYVIDGALAYISATGGNEVYTINGYRVHKFLSSNNFTVTRSSATAALGNVEVLMVAGGGGGGSGPYGYFGGGGAGGLLYYGSETPKTPNGFPLVVNANDTYAVTVGAGGVTNSPGTFSNIAINSNVFLSAIGGGNGQGSGILYAPGGSGGGGSGPTNDPAGGRGAGTAGQGNPGAAEQGYNAGGGGGGAGSPGKVRYQPTSGGTGLTYSISGASVGYAGGGGGRAAEGGGGGSGGGPENTPGTTNTGGGGGGGYTGGAGGSGIVIIRYQFVDSPTYTSLTTPSTFIYESANAVFTLNTVNLANNTLLYYTTVGNIISSNFVSGNTGSFRSTANATTITLATNNTIPANEERSFQLQVRADSLTEPVLLTSNVFTIKDTALAPTYFIGTMYQSASSKDDNGRQITIDNSGNIYISGYTAINSGAAVISKYSNNGIFEWMRTLSVSGGAVAAQGYGVSTDTGGNVYMCGQIANQNDMLIVKYDPYGTIQWQKIYYGGGTDDQSYGLKIYNANIYLSAMSPALGRRTIATMKLNTNGDIVWQKYVGTGDYDNYGREITIDNGGNVYNVGYGNDYQTSFMPIIKYDNDGNYIWQRRFANTTYNNDGKASTSDSTGNVYFAGETDVGGGTRKAFLAKINSSGNLIFQKRISTTTLYDSIYGMASDNDNNIYIAGKSGSNAYVSKLNVQGNILWQQLLCPPVGTADFSGIAVDSTGSTIYLTGTAQSAREASYSDIIFAKLPADGSKSGAYTVAGVTYTYRSANLSINNDTIAYTIPSLSTGTLSLSTSSAGQTSANGTLVTTVTTFI